ncbi:MAG: hypothetical protein K8S23_14820 [Candidatus Cloacimonetes bacterium]|nr:hypothetical protein [Candidatus Cloacimonadota bacterium]
MSSLKTNLDYKKKYRIVDCVLITKEKKEKYFDKIYLGSYFNQIKTKFKSLVLIQESQDIIIKVEKITENDNSYANYCNYFSGKTDDYWKDLEPKNKKYMIISMQEGNFIRNSAKQGEQFSATDVNGKFPILNGIDYKSNNASQKLIYMEV